MNDKERKHQYYLRHKAETIERSDDERRILEAKRQRDRYHDPDKHEALKQYERERKRAWRERKKQELTQANSDGQS